MGRIATQMDAKGLKVKEGHKKVDEPRGPTAKTRRNKDGEWTVKNGTISATNYIVKSIQTIN